ncbi:MAG: DUF3465 domain-containing protein [Candidatus Eremiobacteraeota bacterium]|nr:DUF3465 domain-containing protein [Candidatus Eremiobacteraeota bacterium]
MDLAAAIAIGHRAEVDFSGTVATAPQYFFGTRTRCEHETFAVKTSAGVIHVVDNVALAAPVPVRPGDTIQVRGELVRDSVRNVVHWTHHDPAHRHADGFIRFHGRIYA